MQMRRFAAYILLTLAATFTSAQQDSTWSAYGGDPGGSRYSAASQITRDNLSHLHSAWQFHVPALNTTRTGLEDASFESTPVLLGETLYFTSPFDEVFALNAMTGQQIWYRDPHVSTQDGMLVTSRGVALWPAAATTPDAAHLCATRVFFGTLDARLIALDAATGTLCKDFGTSGEVDLRIGAHISSAGGYGLTSAPTVLGDVVVVGSSVADNQQVDVESGVVRGYDARSGRLLWSWEPLPWAANQHPRTGAGNAWSTISADPELGIVYVPTGSASPDFYGGLRLGDNRDADSVVALDALTGRKVWAFQTVHHNLWDYDVAAQPLLFTLHKTIPAIAIATKSGQVFVLDRRTGQPLYPVEEKAVPQTGVPGEVTSPTQPISSLPPLAPLTPPTANDTSWQRSNADTKQCSALLAGLRYQGIYTPPSTMPTLLYPGSLGGVNWGSLAFDPAEGILYANVNRVPFAVQLIDRSGFYVRWHHDIEPVVRDWPLWIALSLVALCVVCVRRRRWTPGIPGLLFAMAVASIAGVMCLFPMQYEIAHFGTELSPQRGSPYLLHRQRVVDSQGNPCTAPPWGTLTALNLETGSIAWRSSLGTNKDGQATGGLTLGGPIVTAGGLVFTAGTTDARLRAFDSSNGNELWNAKLPAAAQATPMTYTLNGRQFLVIAAGGHAGLNDRTDRTLVAFALDK
jgi:quinoprotein glucose dehydrogenase